MAKMAVIYARVSGDEQMQGGYSIQTQLEKCREYAKQKGYRVVGEYTDAVSGAKLARPGLDAARKELEQHRADAIIIYTNDRLSRNLAHSLILREEFTKWGIELHFVDDGRFDDSAEGRLMQNVKGVVAEYEREKIKERTRRGKIAKAQNGKWHGLGVTFGYTRVGKGSTANLKKDKNAGKVIRRIYTEFLAHKPCYAIAAGLNADRIPAPRSKRGWVSFTVWKVLKNARVYCFGEFKYLDVTITLPDLAFLPSHLANAVERQLQRNGEHARRNTKREYLLAHRVFCACGKRCHAEYKESNGRDHSRYRCWQNTRGEYGIEGRHNTIQIAKLDRAVWAALKEYLDPDKLREGLQELRERKDREQTAEKARIATIDKLIERENKNIETFMSDFANSDDDKVKAEARHHVKQASENKKQLLLEKEELTGQIRQGLPTPEQETELIDLARELHGEFDNATPEQRRRFIDILDVRVDLDPPEDAPTGHPKGRRVKKAWLSFVLTTPEERIPIELTNSPACQCNQPFRFPVRIRLDLA